MVVEGYPSTTFVYLTLTFATVPYLAFIILVPELAVLLNGILDTGTSTISPLAVVIQLRTFCSLTPSTLTIESPFRSFMTFPPALALPVLSTSGVTLLK